MRHGVACAVLFTACAHSEHTGGLGKAEPSGFLKDSSELHPAKDDTEASLVYFIPDKAKFKTYTKVWLEPVQIWRGEKSDAKHVSEYLWSRVDEELRKDYQVTQTAGPGVRRIRIGVTEAGKGIPVLDNRTAAYPAALVRSKGKNAIGGTESFGGKASVEVEMTDSQTGELIAAAVDRRGGEKYAWKALNRWEDFEAASDYWAKKMRGDANCEMPKE